MKKKFLAAIMSAAMISGAVPVMAIAAPVEGDVAETQDVSTTEMPEMETAEKLEPESQTPAAVTMRAGDQTTITDQDGLEEALTSGADTIDLAGAEIELTRPLTISANVTIKNATFKGTAAAGSGNLLTLTADMVTLENVTIVTAAENKSALHVYGTTLDANNLTIDHSSAAGGAPIIINNGAEAWFSGNVSLTLGGNSWYGVNVDKSYADFAEASFVVEGAQGTQSVVCMDDGGVTRE